MGVLFNAGNQAYLTNRRLELESDKTRIQNELTNLMAKEASTAPPTSDVNGAVSPQLKNQTLLHDAVVEQCRVLEKDLNQQMQLIDKELKMVEGQLKQTEDQLKPAIKTTFSFGGNA